VKKIKMEIKERLCFGIVVFISTDFLIVDFGSHSRIKSKLAKAYAK